MRESVGGAMQLYLVMFILFIFIMFLASVVQYARVYKIKNSVINTVERNEGISTAEEIDNVLKQYGYNPKNGYKLCKYSSENKGAYYYIELYATFSFLKLKIDVTIKGETRLIETGTTINADDNDFATSTCIVNGAPA